MQRPGPFVFVLVSLALALGPGCGPGDDPADEAGEGGEGDGDGDGDGDGSSAEPGTEIFRIEEEIIGFSFERVEDRLTILTGGNDGADRVLYDWETGEFLESFELDLDLATLAPLFTRVMITPEDRFVGLVGPFIQPDPPLPATYASAENDATTILWEAEIAGLDAVSRHHSVWLLDDGGSVMLGHDENGYGIAARVGADGEVAWTREWGGGTGINASALAVSVRGENMWAFGERHTGDEETQTQHVLSLTKVSNGSESSSVDLPVEWTFMDLAVLDDQHACVSALDRTQALDAGEPIMLLLDAEGNEQWRLGSIGYPVNGGDDPRPAFWDITAAPDGGGCCMIATRFDDVAALSTVSCADADGNLRWGMALDQGDEASLYFDELEFTAEGDLLVALRNWAPDTGGVEQVRKIARPLAASL